MKGNRPLSYAGFTEMVGIGGGLAGPIYNNFYLHFLEGMDAYRTREYYRVFTVADPSLEAYLTHEITRAVRASGEGSVFDRIFPFQSEMHEAYLSMKTYGVTDEGLFA